MDIVTFTGRTLRLTQESIPNLRRSDLPWQDIVIPLSRINRYLGHTTRPYSVAEHSLHLARVCRSLYPRNPRLYRLALLHDAAEAYLGDWIRPVKAIMPPHLLALEQTLLYRILSVYEVSPHVRRHTSLTEDMATVSLLDNRILVDEWHALRFPRLPCPYTGELAPLGCVVPAEEPADLAQQINQSYAWMKDTP